ncbi:uncharacterized protein TRIADDRAFT_27735 [Trichoplax adhaerens]|uniref:Uncharacterized protein n=1 Tax=Trichoplax adhaerens TaxID=10228 RepID=B3S1N9_TRIAD|nr:hypothetical protein TRIADDRAFT_27735 [Trichoplax adhaerens]EDV23009.1 hypothetical protein TRIADDRAFT_27735 [Trichoplax adhaerens]|eukprot:XP_002113919.1 hypothetical protein TRIADDRAFT_27735 [Trichoplax adhaerens]
MALSNTCSNLYSYYRAIGCICNHVPYTIQIKGGEHFVITSIGKTFHFYDVQLYSLMSFTFYLPSDIECLTVNPDLIFVACSKEIFSFHRTEKRNSFIGHLGRIHSLVTFGEFLLSIDERSNVKIWFIETAELYTEFQFNNQEFRVTCAMHPNTYLNKVLLGCQQGMLQLWNIKTHKLVYTFRGWSSSVLTTVQAPAIDTVAIGLANGSCILHNLKLDKTLMKFKQDSGPITSISFRTDGVPIMATSSPSGYVSFWNLNERTLSSTLRNAHGGLCKVDFVAAQPLLISGGSDNTLKVWVFDKSDESARMLICRSGHCRPPNRARFYGNSSQLIISSDATGSLRISSVVNDAYAHELSKGYGNEKRIEVRNANIPQITAFASDSAREKEWDSIVSCHLGRAAALMWSFRNKSIGKHRLRPPSDQLENNGLTTATAVTITSCGNFAIVGLSTGYVNKFNIQSGQYRGSYGNPKAHADSVQCILNDACNRHLITGGSDKILQCWNLHSRTQVSLVTFNTPVSLGTIHKESCLVAIACEDFTCYVVDIDMMRIIRSFSGHENCITDLALSFDSRWLTTSSVDGSIRTWDIPSARLIDTFQLESPVTSLCFSSTGEYLVITLADSVGLHLWSSKIIYSSVPFLSISPTSMELKDHASLQSLQSYISEKTVIIDNTDHQIKHVGARHNNEPSNLITLSQLPHTHWRNITNLEVIRQRNKPKEQDVTVKPVPFFLRHSKSPKTDPTKSESEVSVIFSRCLQETLTLYPKIRKSILGSDGISIMKSLGPSAIDFEIRMLGPDTGGSHDLLGSFMLLCEDLLKTGNDYEIVQSYLSLFLQVHMKTITDNQILRNQAKCLLEAINQTWPTTAKLLDENLCLVSYCKNLVL